MNRENTFSNMRIARMKKDKSRCPKLYMTESNLHISQ